MKIAILTNFMEFTPGYSLTGIAKDQAWMLSRYGHEVHLFVNEKYNGESFPANVQLRKVIPFAHLKDYSSESQLSEEHKATVAKTAEVLKRELADFDIAFTHDFVFTGWFIPYGMGCRLAGQELPNLRWLHWIHSVPSGNRDLWDIPKYGPRHKIVYPNVVDSLRVAEQFRGQKNDVRVIPHIKDLRSWFDFDEESLEFIDWAPAVMQADIVQVYPASVDRLSAKRVREVILLFSKIKQQGFSVCLVVACQWATGRQQKQDVDQYKKIASRNGLRVGEEVFFTSDFKWDKEKERGKYDVGLPKHILRNLMHCMNLFIFPTREESFGLVLPEASLTSGCMCVVNKSLAMMLEITNYHSLAFDFGSFHTDFKCDDEDRYMRDVAHVIIGRMRQNESLMTKTFMRQRYNVDSVYRKYYEPIMAEAQLW